MWDRVAREREKGGNTHGSFHEQVWYIGNILCFFCLGTRKYEMHLNALNVKESIQQSYITITPWSKLYYIMYLD